MKEIKKYADEWDVSAKHFYDNGYYTWMQHAIGDFDTILEIGCGTGYSTLSLIENGHKVIAIDKNSECIKKARNLIESSSVDEGEIVFLEGDITDDEFRNTLLSSFKFDAVICWNIGSYWSKEMVEFYLPPMLEYGLSLEQIVENPESSYSELILWEACRLAKEKHVPIHIIDRGLELLNVTNDQYYKLLKEEFNFHEIVYNNLSATSISNSGRVLSVKGNKNSDEILKIVLLSILIK